MFDEFSAEHRDIGIEVGSVVFVTLRAVFVFVSGAMERIGGAVYANEALAALNSIQQGAFTRGSHRWLFVCSGLCEVTCGIKEKSIELGQVIAAEFAAILRKREDEVVCLFELVQQTLDETRRIAMTLD